MQVIQNTVNFIATQADQNRSVYMRARIYIRQTRLVVDVAVYELPLAKKHFNTYSRDLGMT